MIQPVSRQLSGFRAYLAQAGYGLLLIIITGLAISGISPFLAEQTRGYVNVNFDQNVQGEVVLKPITGGEAELAGVEKDDVLLSVNGKSVPAGTSTDQAAELLQGKVGETVQLTIRSVDGIEKGITIVRSRQYLQALASVGMSASTVNTLFLLIELVLNFAVILISLWIFLKHKNDWLMILAAAVLLVLPAGMGVTNLPYTGAQQLGIYPLYTFIHCLALGLGVLFLFVFPNGVFFPRWTKWFAIAAGIYALLFWLIFLKFNDLLYTWLWLAFFLVGVYALLRRTIQDAAPGGKKQIFRLLYGTIAVIVVFILITIYNQLPSSTLPRAGWIILDLVRNALVTAAMIFFAVSLAQSLKEQSNIATRS
jgi:hypothetical protein